VNLEDAETTIQVRSRHHDASVETTWSHERWIEYVWTVGSRDEDNALVALETIHLNEELVERLLTLIVTTTHASTTVTTYGIDLIDEDDTRSVLLTLNEEVTNSGRSHSHEHLNKVRTGDAKERHTGFTSDSFGQERFTSSW
jgi:hypothetical protein